MNQSVVPNQVFIGCPWKNIRPKYESALEDLKRKYPLHFVIIGRDNDQNAEELLTVIKDKLLSSSYAIFDVTGGNANVSLEFGMAEASEMKRALYLNVHGRIQKRAKDSAIISDLAGKRRNQYKNDKALRGLLSAFCKAHPYTKRFEKALSSLRSRVHATGKRTRTLALKVVHCLSPDGKARRADVVQDLKAMLPFDYKEKEIDFVLEGLHRAGVIQVSRGRFATIEVK